MPSGIHQITDVPADQVGQVVSDYYDDGAQSVEVLRQADGKFTVRAYFKPTRSASLDAGTG
ncbi:MAG TPA: hypothetical protein PKE29_01500 [Phycisphaerales bacterium]|nr:hypothetical protein [Phycisphaerales bacterium]